MPAALDHAYVTLWNADLTAAWMCALFDWHIRWEGPSLDGGKSLHVGTKSQYIALYQPDRAVSEGRDSYTTKGGLNHIAVVVEDLAKTEKFVAAMGFTPQIHADYAPGKRFYFLDQDGIEYEIVSYA